MILKGNDLLIKAGGVAIAAAKSCELVIDDEEIATASPTNGTWKESIMGRKSWKVSANHLLTNLVNSATMVGSTITLDVYVRDNVGTPFSGFVNNVTLQLQGYNGTPDAIYWDKSRNMFVGRVGLLYYSTWTNGSAYVSPSDYDMFSYNGIAYSWYNAALTAEKLSGQAHVKTWKVSGARGSLASGIFDFSGTGPLTPASLPTT